jgi:hypothetical protein
MEVYRQSEGQPKIWAIIRNTGQSCKEFRLYKGPEVIKTD